MELCFCQTEKHFGQTEKRFGPDRKAFWPDRKAFRPDRKAFWPDRKAFRQNVISFWTVEILYLCQFWELDSDIFCIKIYYDITKPKNILLERF